MAGKVHYVFRRVSFIINNARSAFNCCSKAKVNHNKTIFPLVVDYNPRSTNNNNNNNNNNDNNDTLYYSVKSSSKATQSSLIGDTVHNTGISLLLSTSVWVLLSPPIER